MRDHHDDHHDGHHDGAHQGPRDGDGSEPPFGLPVLEEVPELAQLLLDLREIDRLVARAIDRLLLLQDEQVAEATTGVALGQWLAAVGRRTGTDRRMLATAAATCRRFPALHDGLRAGTVSWCQLRAIACKLHRLGREHDARIETELTHVLATSEDDAEPEALARIVEWTLRDLFVEPEPEQEPRGGHDFLSMQPRLDGTGGSVYGEFGAEGFATLDAYLNAGLHPEGPAKDGLGADPDADAGARTGASLARQRAQRLLGLCVHGADVPTPAGPATTRAPVASRPKLLARVELASLLAGDLPAALLTHLTGGVMQVEARAMRVLADRLGAEVRLVVHDQGRVIGVGRSTRRPPGWLRDAVLAMHDTCAAPGCRAAARVCDLDHARPWNAGGRTDLDNLAPACATDNHAKEPDGWRCEQGADGARAWHHPRSGLRTHTYPATWRPRLGLDPP